ncbi:hypothetical protein J437_LFUL015506 [Ladona fulva]|uniref:Uncharacterized protein n=1 Tax=Ladona fulva TaxID=123851 RepID=A0A8K0KII5_LADFU|nr:hypothetical protein J437_LFUL015506 [Ladona fulva]
MNDCNGGFPMMPSTPSYEVEEGSPAFESHCQYEFPSVTIKNSCEVSSNGIFYEGSETTFDQSLKSGNKSLEENESSVTAYFVSNGYYGFQPLTLTMVTEVECQMDVGDLNAVEGAEGSSCHETIANGTSFEPYRWQSQLEEDNCHKGFTVLGKRNWDGVTETQIEVKRIRQEEPAALTLCLYKDIDNDKTPFTPKSIDCHYPRCNITQYV